VLLFFIDQSKCMLKFYSQQIHLLLTSMTAYMVYAIILFPIPLVFAVTLIIKFVAGKFSIATSSFRIFIRIYACYVIAMIAKVLSPNIESVFIEVYLQIFLYLMVFLYGYVYFRRLTSNKTQVIILSSLFVFLPATTFISIFLVYYGLIIFTPFT
jgi:hypothetical protein